MPKTLFSIIVMFFILASLGCRKNEPSENKEKTAISGIAETMINIACMLKVETIDNDIHAFVTFTNNSDRGVPILRWKLLMDDKITWSAFTITLDSKTVPYTGRTIKRGSPSKDDFFSLAPGASITSVIKIRDYYSIGDPGEYDIAYFSYNHLPENNDVFEIRSNTVEYTVK